MTVWCVCVWGGGGIGDQGESFTCRTLSVWVKSDSE